LTVIFALLGSVPVKAAQKMLMKLTKGIKPTGVGWGWGVGAVLGLGALN